MRHQTSQVRGLNDSSPVPAIYNSNTEIRGVYNYVHNNLGVERWEDVAKEFAKEQTGLSIQGRGSIKISCQIIQNNWKKFTTWITSRYPNNAERCY